jgi:hypothetical protein
VNAWSATDHCRRGYGPSADWKAGLRRDGFRGKSASGLYAGQFQLHDFSYIGEELVEMAKKPLSVLSKLLLKPAGMPEFIEDLPNGLKLAKKKNKKRREQTKPNALDEDQCEVQRCEVSDGDHDMLQSNVKFASLKQALSYGDIPDYDPIDYHDVDVGQGSPEELADAIEGLITSAEQEGMSRDGSQSFATVGDRVQGRFQAQAWRRPS